MGWFDGVKRWFGGRTTPVPVDSQGPSWAFGAPSASADSLLAEALAAGVDLGGLALIDAGRARRRVVFTHLVRESEVGPGVVYELLYVVRSGSFHRHGGAGRGLPPAADASEIRALSSTALTESLAYPARASDYVPLDRRNWEELPGSSEPFQLETVTNRFTRTASSEVDAAEAALGLRFPPGYREYVTTYGDALVESFVRIDLPSEVVAHRWDLATHLESFDRFPSDGVLDFEDRLELIALGDTVAGDTIAFHALRPELIFVLPRHDEGVRFAGRSLSAALRYLFSGELAAPMPRPLILPEIDAAEWESSSTDTSVASIDRVVAELLAVLPRGSSVVRSEDEHGEHARVRVPSAEALIAVDAVADEVSILVRSFADDPYELFASIEPLAEALGFE